MGEKFSRRDFLKGMAVVTASGLLVACGGGNGTPVKLAFVAMDNFYDQDETPNGYVLCQGFQVKNLSASDITLDGLLDFETYDKKEREVGVEEAIRALAGSSKTITAKTSAGALNYTPVAKVTNLGKTIDELKEAGIWFVCADMDGDRMYDLNLKGPIGMVIGNEGEGVSRLIREKCDFTAAIPMKGDIDSLNASVAAGILAYEIVRQRLS